MGVQIIEQFICSKYPDQQTCEDGLFISSDFIAVIDGVTSKGELTWPDPSEGGSGFLPPMTSGRYAREILTQALKTMEPGIDAASAMEYLNQALATAAGGRRDFLRDHPEERLQAVIILYSCQKKEVWAFGDCQCLIGDPLHSHSKEIDGLMAEIRCLYNQAELILGRSEDELARHDPGRACILPLLRRQFLLANRDRPYGYDVLDGFAIQPHHVSVYPVPPQTQVVLSSDGYPVLKGTLAESEKALDELLQKDPQCLRENRGTKGLVKGNRSFDDRTYVRFVVL